ncbi:MAG TPA: hypothetical protein PLZ33_09225, partial [Smithellaceae bacterium]|nr:hypothetical protein [Smithellaceae bacterium]
WKACFIYSGPFHRVRQSKPVCRPGRINYDKRQKKVSDYCGEAQRVLNSHGAFSVVSAVSYFPQPLFEERGHMTQGKSPCFHG